MHRPECYLLFVFFLLRCINNNGNRYRISTRNDANLADATLVTLAEMPNPPKCINFAKIGVYTAGNCRPLQNENAGNLMHITFAQNQDMRNQINPFIRSCVNSNTGKVYWSIHKKYKQLDDTPKISSTWNTFGLTNGLDTILEKYIVWSTQNDQNIINPITNEEKFGQKQILLSIPYSRAENVINNKYGLNNQKFWNRGHLAPNHDFSHPAMKVSKIIILDI